MIQDLFLMINEPMIALMNMIINDSMIRNVPWAVLL